MTKQRCLAALDAVSVSYLVPVAAWTTSARKDAIGRPAVLSYPSKSEAMVVDESLIFRSDSNCEDLAGFAGAGLYDSVTTKEYQVIFQGVPRSTPSPPRPEQQPPDQATLMPLQTRRVDYTIDRLVTDPEFRQDLLGRICKVRASLAPRRGGQVSRSNVHRQLIPKRPIPAQVGAAIEESMGCPQDIEGVVDHSGTIWIVQARPQV